MGLDQVSSVQRVECLYNRPADPDSLVQTLILQFNKPSDQLQVRVLC